MNRLRRILHAVAIVSFLLGTWAQHVQGADTLLDSLFRSGVPVSMQEVVTLPPPTLADGLSSQEQRTVIEKLVGEKYGWDAFSRNSVVAPFMIKIADNSGPNARIGRRVDLWFIAYGDLKTLQSDDFLNSRFQGAAGAGDENATQTKLLSAANLTERHLKTPETATDPRYVATEASLFEKVRLSVTTRNEKTLSAGSVVVASLIDPVFNNDPVYPNTWRSITRDAAGKRELGKPQIYVGMGSYVKATTLAEPAGAMFIEYHAAFAEPEGWFQGANLLRSKLPIVAQDNVRKFRRSLHEK